jgi:hypothetical protein
MTGRNKKSNGENDAKVNADAGTQKRSGNNWH